MQGKMTVIPPKNASVIDRKKVAAYARVSSGKDAMLHSLSAQISYYSTMIQRNGDWQFSGVYADEAMTGTKDSRPEFHRMISDCKAGKVDMIITKSISRFARNTVTLLETVRMLKSVNVDVYFEEQNIHSMSGDGELMLTILASFAQEESLSVSENCKWRIRNDFKKGKLRSNLQRFYGYIRLADGGLAVVEEEARIIRYMAQRYLAGVGFRKISDELNELGVKTLAGKEWSYSSIRQILINEKNAGDLRLQKTFSLDHISKKRMINKGQLNQYYVEDNHPAILSKEIFSAIQNEIYRRAKRNVGKVRSEVYPFTGIIRCENCGAKYNRKISNCSNKYRRVFWNCSTFLNKGKSVCHTKQIPEEEIYKLSCEVLEVKEFDEEIFRDNIKEITVPAWNVVTFVFHDGTKITKTWKDKSRKWTDEMKAENYENLRRNCKS